MSETTTEVRRELVLETEPERVWEALTTEELLERWLADEVTLEPFEGGSVVARDREGRGRSGVVERLDEPSELVLRWRDDDGVESRVELRVSAVAGGSRLVVVESAPFGPVATALAGVNWGMRFAALAAAVARVVAFA